jgi:hypothetical protein
MLRTYPRMTILSLALLAACGRSSSDTAGDTAVTLKVTGSLADWPGAVGSFAGYIMVLYNVDSGEVKRATIAANSTGFSIEGVTSGARYSAVLLDPSYRFGWILQIPGRTNTDKYYQTFRFASAGRLGSLSTTGKILYTSEQSDLVPDESVAFQDEPANGVPDGLESTITTNTTNVSGSDMDADGIPNPFDTDIDNDGVVNWLDAKSGRDSATSADKDVAWASNGLVSAESGAVFRHVVSELHATGSKVTLFPLFTVPAGQFASVTVESGTFLEGATYSVGGEAFSGALYDDGTHGDGVAGDGNWSVPLLLAAGKEPTSGQVFFVKGTLPDGTVREYAVNVGGVLNTGVGTVSYSSGTLSWTASTLGSTIGHQVLVYSSSGARVYASDVLSATATSHSLANAGLTTGTSYNVEVRVIAPSPRHGFPGSSWRSTAISITY